MNILTPLWQPLARALAAMHAPTQPLRAGARPATPPELVDEDDTQDDAAPACGWFDSSWELRQGLAVSECAMDRVQRQVPLSWLLQ